MAWLGILFVLATAFNMNDTSISHIYACAWSSFFVLYKPNYLQASCNFVKLQIYLQRLQLWGETLATSTDSPSADATQTAASSS